MAEVSKTKENAPGKQDSALVVAAAPHLPSRALSTRRMMLDVLIAAVPLFIAAGVVFRWYALKQIGICVVSCLAAELIFTALRARRATVGDLSAVVTGMILAMSLPWSAPWYVGMIGSFVAIGIGKAVFGGIGQNMFNPAMVGRAFVMIAFPAALGAAGYVQPGHPIEVLTQATPLTALKESISAGTAQTGADWSMLWPLFIGYTNGSLGETSALAALAGGLYLCIRRTASWEIPLSMIAGAAVVGGIVNAFNPASSWTVLHHLLGGALLFGAFFIATDPVSSPLTPRGKWIFGAGIGVLVMLMRNLSGYPEGVMFSVLLMNAAVPLINRSTIPRPVGGPVPEKTAA